MSDENIGPVTPEPGTDPDTADQAAGYRSVIDEGEIDDMAPTDPNLAVGHGDDDLTAVGDLVDDGDGDDGVADILRQIDKGGA